MTLAPHQHARIDALEREMAVHPGRVSLQVRHDFLPGLYIRTLIIPKGTLLTGEEHKTRHAWTLIKGTIEVAGVGVLTAPACGITEPGTRRVARVFEDAEWATFHPTALTDPVKIREEIINIRHHLDGLEPTEAKFKALAAGGTS